MRIAKNVLVRSHYNQLIIGGFLNGSTDEIVMTDDGLSTRFGGFGAITDLNRKYALYIRGCERDEKKGIPSVCYIGLDNKQRIDILKYKNFSSSISIENDGLDFIDDAYNAIDDSKKLADSPYERVKDLEDTDPQAFFFLKKAIRHVDNSFGQGGDYFITPADVQRKKEQLVSS